MAFIIYVSREKLTPDHHPVRAAIRRGPEVDQIQFYVRAQHIPASETAVLPDCIRALTGEQYVQIVPDDWVRTRIPGRG